MDAKAAGLAVTVPAALPADWTITDLNGHPRTTRGGHGTALNLRTGGIR